MAFRDLPRMGVAQIDWDTGELKFHDLDGAAAQEPLFVPRDAPTAPEGDGFILTVVDRFAESAPTLLILDGNDVSRAPAAVKRTIKLPIVSRLMADGVRMPPQLDVAARAEACCPFQRWPRTSRRPFRSALPRTRRSWSEVHRWAGLRAD